MPLTAASNIQSLRGLSTASRGHLELQLGMDACFSSERILLDISWTAQGGEVTLDAGGGPVRRRRLAAEEIHAYVEKLADAMLRAEVPVGGRSTTRHFGTARWEAIADQGAETGEAQWETRDLPLDTVLEILARRPELAGRLPRSPYVIAFGVRAIVDQLAELAGSDSGLHTRGSSEEEPPPSA